jgi:hypothetical protein
VGNSFSRPCDGGCFHQDPHFQNQKRWRFLRGKKKRWWKKCRWGKKPPQPKQSLNPPHPPPPHADAAVGAGAAEYADAVPLEANIPIRSTRQERTLFRNPILKARDHCIGFLTFLWRDYCVGACVRRTSGRANYYRNAALQERCFEPPLVSVELSREGSAGKLGSITGRYEWELLLCYR